MDAIILAAGLGKRLRPHTEATPKPLLPVQGRPILDWALGALPAAVDRVLVVVNYLGEQIEGYLGRQKHFARWEAVRQEAPRGTGDALRSCRDRIESGRFLVLNGDDLYGAADLSRLAACPAGLLTRQVQNPREFGVAVLKADGTLEKLVEKPDVPGPRLANAGAYVFPRHVFATELRESARGEYEITDYVTALAGREPVSVIEATFWLPIGDVAAWQAAQGMDLASPLAGRANGGR
jgi:bifunctional UDP-N-acetylglucosamine pyrophosphorylase/glucosamine-1-phosphate N-acetyltransferase